MSKRNENALAKHQPFLGEHPSQDHVYEHATTAKHDVHSHRYVVCESSIIQSRQYKEKCDLNEIR